MKEVSGTDYYAVLELPNVRESPAIYVLRDRKYMAGPPMPIVFK